MRYFQLIALAACILLSASVLADDDADIQAGLHAYEQGDYKAALDIWQAVASKGHVGAQFNLGLMYDQGAGVGQDYRKAVEWYRKAAEQGNARRSI